MARPAASSVIVLILGFALVGAVKWLPRDWAAVTGALTLWGGVFAWLIVLQAIDPNAPRTQPLVEAYLRKRVLLLFHIMWLTQGAWIGAIATGVWKSLAAFALIHFGCQMSFNVMSVLNDGYRIKGLTLKGLSIQSLELIAGVCLALFVRRLF